MGRPLGDNQRHVLWTLAQFNDGVWYPGAGWMWANTSTTIRLLDSLVRRGLATKEMRTRMIGPHPEPYPYYKITDQGKQEAGSPGTLPARRKGS